MTRKGPMPLALYHQIYMVLREKLLGGEFPVNQAIPSEVALAEQYGVSRVTIRATLEKLESDGLISREKGRGTFPIPPKPLVSKAAPADMRGFLDSLVQLGLRTKAKVLEFEYTVPSPEIADRLGIGPGGVVLRTTRLYTSKGAPFSYVTGYLREEIGRTFTKADLDKGPMLPLLEKTGVRVARVEQVVTSRLADPNVAKYLDVPIGSAVTLMERVIFDETGRALDVNIGLYRPDRYTFQLDLERPADGSAASWTSAAQLESPANSEAP
ncbi:MAG: GntR family transcriptional regulator [Rhizobiaceae bacterium]|nr:GntR family transcriptional regulator [Rhizobiaceae bacterium]